MSEITGRGLARSSLQMQAAQLSQMALRLVLTPLVIARLGLEGYGVWVLLFSLCSYATALNTGVAWAYVKLTAELDERRDYAVMAQVVSSGAALMTTVAAVLLGALWLARAALLPRIGVPLPRLAEAQTVLAVLSAAVVVEAGLGCTLYVLAGLQRMDLQYRLMLAGSLADFATAFALLTSGYGMTSLACGWLAGQVVSAGAAWTLCRRLRPALTISPWHAGPAGLRRMMPLGFRLQGVVLLNVVAKESVRLSISSLFGAAALGTYQLADRLLFAARSPAAAILAPLMPAFSSLAAGAQPARTRRLFAQASTVTAVGAAFALLFAAVFAESLVFAFTGRHLPEVAWTVRVLAPAEFAALLTGVAVAALRAAGTVGWELRFGLATSVLALAGAVVGNTVGGFAASIIGIAAGRGTAAAWLLMRLPASWGLDRFEYVRRSLSWSLLAVPPVLLAAKLAPVGLVAGSGRWQALATLAALAALSALAVAAVTWLLLSGEDRAAARPPPS